MAGDLQHPQPGQAKINTGDYIRMQNRVDAMYKALSTLPGVVMDDFISLHLIPSKATAAQELDLSLFRFGEVSRTADEADPTVVFNSGTIFWGPNRYPVTTNLTATLSIGATNYVYLNIPFTSPASSSIQVTSTEANAAPTSTDYRVWLMTYTVAAAEKPVRVNIGHVGNVHLSSTFAPA